MAAGHRDHFPPWALALSTFVAAALIAMPSLPGRMNADALDMYGQALGAAIHDWHAPIIPWLWRIIGASPALVAVHTTLVVFVIVYAVALTLRANGLSPLMALLAAFGLSLFPPVLNQLVAVSKDTWLAAIFLALFAASSGPRRAELIYFRAMLVALAPFIRPETILLAAVFIWGEYILAGRKLADAVRYSCALLLSAAILGVLVAEVVRPERRHAEGGIFLFDLAGISIRTNQLLLRPASFPANDLAVLRQHYWPDSLMPIAWGKPDTEMVKFVVGDDLAELRRDWVAAIATHPLHYLATRAGVVLAYLGGHWRFHPGIDPNAEIHLFWPGLNRMVDVYLESAPGFLSSHWLTLFGAMALLALVVQFKLHLRRPEWMVYLVLAIVYQIILLPLIVVPDFRFGYGGVILFFLIVGLSVRGLALTAHGRAMS